MTGRRFPVVVVGLAAYLTVIALFNVLGTGALGDSWAAPIVALVSAIAAGTLVYGVASGSALATRLGLLAATGVLVSRSAFLLIVDQAAIGVWLGLCIAFIAGGTYLHEARRGPPRAV